MNNNFEEIQSITIIGGGNVAWLYNHIMKKQGLDVSCISSRGEIREEDLMSDLIIIAVSDNAIDEVVARLNIKESILVHTSGSMDMEVLNSYAENYGVFYPLQTISKLVELNFPNFPMCIEANNKNTLNSLFSLANKLSDNVYEISSFQRQYIHLAAVFASNFTNHIYGVAKEELKKKDIPFEILFPLIDQSIEKIKHKNPFEVQTGPAKRNDSIIMEKHKTMLYEDEREIYEVLSNMIIKKQNSLKQNK